MKALHKITKTILKVLTGIAIAWASILIITQIAVSPKVLEKLIDKYGSEYVDGDISLGKASLHLFRHFPNIGVSLEDFNITYPGERYDSLQTEGVQGYLSSRGLGEQSDTLASFKRFTVSVNAVSFLRGKISIPFAELVRPRIYAHRYADGQANWDIVRLPEADTTETDSNLLDLKLGRISLTEHPHIVYTDSKDSIFAVADMKRFALNGGIITSKISNGRIGVKMDSLFVAGRIAEDTLAFGMDHLGIFEKQDMMRLHASANTLLATRALGRMRIPIEIKSSFHFSNDDVPEVRIEDFKADIASIPLEGNAHLRLNDGRTSIDGAMSVNGCKMEHLFDSFLKIYIPQLNDIQTDAQINLDLQCKGDYIHSTGELPEIMVSLNIPDSKLRHRDIGSDIDLRLDVSAMTDDSRISASLNDIHVQTEGLKLDASADVTDLMVTDPLINLNGQMSADLSRLESFIPDTLGIDMRGTLEADLKGSLRMSQINIYGFAEADLDGRIDGKGIEISSPKDSLDAQISNLNITLGPETRTSRLDSSMTFRLMSVKGEMDKADIRFGLMKLNCEQLIMSAMNSSDGNDTTTVGRLGGRIKAKRIIFNDASGIEVDLRGTSNGVQMLPKKGRPEVPVLTLSSTNDHIYYKDGTNRAILTDADIHAMAAMNSIERKQKAKAFMDSLYRKHPDIPKDSLMSYLASKRKARELPEWLSDEDFRKQDINIKLDETLSKYFREWDMKGKIDIRTGIVMTPYFPLTNIIRGFQVQFDNDKIAIDSVKFKSGKSEIAGKGEVTGLRRALLGRGGLNVGIDITSKAVNANELLIAYNSGSRYTPPTDKKEMSEVSDAQFLKMVVKDTVSVEDKETPLIVIPSNLNADINLDVSNISFSNIDIERLTAKMMMKERCVQITDTKAESNIGDISFDGFYATRSKKNLKAGFSFNFKDITAEKVIDLIPTVDSLMPLLKSFNGQLNCELAATASLDTNMNILPPSINGIIRIGGQDLTIKDSEMYRDLAKKLLFKNKREGYIKEMSVEGVIADSKLEVFPFVVKLDRYTLALSGVQNLDQSFKYHASLLKSPFLIRLGFDLYGPDFDNMRFKIGKAKYKNTNVPVFSAVIDTTRLNLVNSIRGIFEKGVEAAIHENEKKTAIEEHKQKIGYVQAIDQELVALSEKEQKQMEEEEAALKEAEEAQDALAKAVEQIRQGIQEDLTKNNITNE